MPFPGFVMQKYLSIKSYDYRYFRNEKFQD
jgi:hypothetical protein